MPYVFAGYTFDRDAGLKFGSRDIALPPKERDVLHFLLGAQGRVVSKDDVVRAAWQGGAVSDESISRAVYRLRLAMQAAGGPPVVTTVYNGGFRISAVVHERAVLPRASLATQMPARHAHIIWPMLLSGHEFAARLSSKDIDIALQAANAAVALDPAYAPAWIAIAEFHVLQATRSIVPARQAGQLAIDAAARALAAYPDCGPGLAIRGWVRAMVEGALQEGLDDIDRALQLDPDYWGIYMLRAWVMQAVGQHEEAVSMARHAQALNAYSLFVGTALPQYLLYAGRTVEALQMAQALAQRFPSVDSAQEILSVALCVQGRLDEALNYAQRAADLGLDSPLMLGQLAYVLARLERHAEVDVLLKRMQEQCAAVPHTSIAAIQLARGERARALHSLRQAKAAGIPQFFGMRDDPRWLDCMREVEFRMLWDA